MKHACNLIPMEEGTIPPEVRAEAISSKARARARLEEVVGRIREQNQELAIGEAPEAATKFDEELDSIAHTD